MVGPTSQQDVELSALYRDSVITYGEGKVLGILATRSNDHAIRKRATNDEQPPQEPTPSTSTPTEATQEVQQSNGTDFIYYPGNTTNNKILLYTSAAPILFDGKNKTVLNNDIPLTITTKRNTDSTTSSLSVRYNYKSPKEKVRRATICNSLISIF